MAPRNIECLATEIAHASTSELTTRSHSIVKMLLSVIEELRIHSEQLGQTANNNGDMLGERSVKLISERLSNLHSMVKNLLQDKTLTQDEMKNRLSSATSAVLSIQRAHEAMFGTRLS